MSYTELRRAIPGFEDLRAFLAEFPGVVDTRKLAEFFCAKLFSLKLMRPSNRYYYDAVDPAGKRVARAGLSLKSSPTYSYDPDR